MAIGIPDYVFLAWIVHSQSVYFQPWSGQASIFMLNTIFRAQQNLKHSTEYFIKRNESEDLTEIVNGNGNLMMCFTTFKGNTVTKFYSFK